MGAMRFSLSLSIVSFSSEIEFGAYKDHGNVGRVMANLRIPLQKKHAIEFVRKFEWMVQIEVWSIQTKNVNQMKRFRKISNQISLKIHFTTISSKQKKTKKATGTQTVANENA